MTKTRDLADLGGGFIQSGTGAVQRTVELKLQDVVSVKDFGAVGDGVTDDTAAIQAAIDSLSNGGTLLFPFGVYIITDSLEVGVSNLNIAGNNSTIDGSGMEIAAQRGEALIRFVSPSASVATTLSASASAGDTQIQVTSSTGMQVGNLVRCISDKVQYRNSSVLAYFNDQNIIKAITGATITLEHPLTYDLDISGNTVSVTAVSAIENLKVTGLTFIGAGEYFPNPTGGGGASHMGLYFYKAKNVLVKNCAFRNLQGAAVWAEYVNDIEVSHCFIEGYDETVATNSNTAFYGVYFVRGRNARFTNSSGVRVRHLADSSEWYDFLQANCLAQSTHLAAFGSHEETYRLCVSNCTATNCYAFATVRALTASIVNNTFQSGPLTSAFISTATMNASDPGRMRLVIQGNYAETMGTSYAVNLTTSTDLLKIANNDFADSFIRCYSANQQFANVTISDNDVSVVDFIGTSAYPHTNVHIANNRFYTDTAITGHVIIRGCTNSTTPSDYFFITGNSCVSTVDIGSLIIIRNEGYYGEHFVVKNNYHYNDTSRCVTIQGTGANFKSWPIVENNYTTLTDSFGSSDAQAVIWADTSSTPSNLADATIRRGDIIENRAPSAANAKAWVCTAGGTFGSITGVTATTTAGSSTVTLVGNTATKVYPGSYITIAGEGGSGRRVLTVSADYATITLSDNATNSVTGADVSRNNPTLAASNLA